MLMTFMGRGSFDIPPVVREHLKVHIVLLCWHSKVPTSTSLFPNGGGGGGGPYFFLDLSYFHHCWRFFLILYFEIFLLLALGTGEGGGVAHM